MTEKKNTGNRNTGYRNTGDCNTGNWNTGNRNTGYRNTGYCNTGDCNTGNWNTGDWNTGNRNTGYRNTGNWNTGYCNTGNWNTGNWNTGYCNTGYCNTGNWNTGDWNTGNWNTGNWNTGYCNSRTPEDCLVFNKPAKIKDWNYSKKPNWMMVSLTQWVMESDMTDKEKDAYPTYVTTGGYLKAYSSLKHAYVDAWEKTTEEDRDLTKSLPNFDPDVFEEVFGFQPFKNRTIIIDGKEIEISEESFLSIKEQLLK